MGSVAENNVLLEVTDLKKYFPVRKGLFSRVQGHVRAVDGISFTIGSKKTLGLVGESGCGKTTAGRTILRLLEPTEGDVRFEGHSVFELHRKQLRRMREDMQIVFQDPFGSLNPRMTVGSIVGEPLAVHRRGRRKERKGIVRELLEKVGLSADAVNRYPHEFSGGQRQRIGIARAIALKPKFVVCDEAVSALDVSIQAQIINLLQDLQEDFGLSYLFIAHDLSVVQHVSDRVAVMYLGKIVEMGDAKSICDDPQHPYTVALMSAVPVPDPKTKMKRIILPGDVPSPVDPPPGCRFHTRCKYVMDICRKEEPPLRDRGGGHLTACFLEKGVSM
ncbi:dipeptide ABC transporter ATP-binding protein [bacterium]|nr:dipeptide ABC transporter ATP-binding protein [bacterium]